MRPADKAVKEALEILSKAGMTTVAIIGKCPDSEDFLFEKQGNKVYLRGGLEMAQLLVTNEFFVKNMRPPGGEDWKQQ